ncbi:MAG TPA: HPr family phosphocarrier protein [Nitrosospira sp.]
MQQKEVKILNKLGLHARASAKLTHLAGQFRSEVWISRNGRKVNAKSIMGVMMLAASQGVTLDIETSGADEIEAMRALTGLIEERFGESE